MRYMDRSLAIANRFDKAFFINPSNFGIGTFIIGNSGNIGLPSVGNDLPARKGIF